MVWYSFVYMPHADSVLLAKSSDFIEMLRGTSFVGTLMQLSKKVPIITILTPLFIPLKVLRRIPATFKANSEEVKLRIENRGKTRHPDFMDYMIAPEDPPPKTKKELIHIEQVAFQMFIAGFDPVQITFYSALFFLAKYPKILAILTKEIRDAFQSYEEITPDALFHLKYLYGFIYESLRVHLTTATGLPRVSPGAMVDGVYVPKGVNSTLNLLPLTIVLLTNHFPTQVVVQLSSFTAMRSPQYFADPLEFHPERWLPPEHPLYSTRYANDNLKAFFPFSLGPRQCTGREIAWSQTRLFLGKVLWTFDLEGVRGHEKSFDKDFRVFVLWDRPELYVRFLPAKR
jgi:cytochrome P450